MFPYDFTKFCNCNTVLLQLHLNAQCTLKKTGGLIATYTFACSWPVTLGEVWFSQHHAMCRLILSAGDKVLIWFRTKTLSLQKH